MTQQAGSSRFPYLPIQVQIGGTVLYEGEALLDTGFTGAVVLPTSYLPENVRAETPGRWRMPDGNLVTAPRYRGIISVGNFLPIPFPVLVTILGDEAIIGVHVIRHFSVILDHGRRVIVEP